MSKEVQCKSHESKRGYDHKMHWPIGKVIDVDSRYAFQPMVAGDYLRPGLPFYNLLGVSVLSSCHDLSLEDLDTPKTGGR